MIVSRPSLVAIGIAAVLLVNSQLPAAEHGDIEIIKLYDEFNAELRRVGSNDPDALNRFYTKAHRAANRCSFFDFNCRMSGRIFDEVITLTKYEIVSIENLADGSVDLMVSGNNVEGVGVGLIVKWLFEDGGWRIDSIAKGPPDWDQLKRKPRPKPITPN